MFTAEDSHDKGFRNRSDHNIGKHDADDHNKDTFLIFFFFLFSSSYLFCYIHLNGNTKQIKQPIKPKQFLQVKDVAKS